MNRKGFSLIELLACMALLGLILSIGLYLSKDTLSMAATSLNGITDNEIFDSAQIYVVEENVLWNDGYTCVMVSELVDNGYFDSNEVADINDKVIKLTRNEKTKVITNVYYVDECK